MKHFIGVLGRGNEFQRKIGGQGDYSDVPSLSTEALVAAVIKYDYLSCSKGMQLNSARMQQDGDQRV